MVNFNIIEEDYDYTTEEEIFQCFREDYLHDPKLRVLELQEKYGLTYHRRSKYVKRIQEEDGVKRCWGKLKEAVKQEKPSRRLVDWSKYEAFKEGYLNHLDVRVYELRRLYNLREWEYKRFIHRIWRESGLRRNGGWGNKLVPVEEEII